MAVGQHRVVAVIFRHRLVVQYRRIAGQRSDARPPVFNTQGDVGKIIVFRVAADGERAVQRVQFGHANIRKDKNGNIEDNESNDC